MSPSMNAEQIAEFLQHLNRVAGGAEGARFYMRNAHYHNAPDYAYEQAVWAFHYANIVLDHLR